MDAMFFGVGYLGALDDARDDEVGDGLEPQASDLVCGGCYVAAHGHYLDVGVETEGGWEEPADDFPYVGDADGRP